MRHLASELTRAVLQIRLRIVMHPADVQKTENPKCTAMCIMFPAAATVKGCCEAEDGAEREGDITLSQPHSG